MYVCMSGQQFQQSMDQPGMVTSTTRGQRLNSKHIFFPVPVRAREINLARRFRPVSARSFSTLRLNLIGWCLFRGFLPLFSTASTCNRQPPSGQSRVYRITQSRTDGVHCRESTSTGPLVLKVVRVTGAAVSGFSPWTNFLCASLFPHPLMVCMYYI